MGNNYLLYNNPTENRFYFIPFDLQGTFFKTNVETMNIYEWAKQARVRSSPLTARSIKCFRKMYTELWKLFLVKIWKMDGLVHQRIIHLQQYLLPMVQKDLIFQTFGQNHTVEKDFIGEHRRILDYLNKRHSVAREQLDN